MPLFTLKLALYDLLSDVHSSLKIRVVCSMSSPRLPAEKRLEQADPDRASIQNLMTPPHPPPTLWDPPPIAWRSSTPPPPTPPPFNPAALPPLFCETLFPPFLSWGRPGCRGGARKRLQLKRSFSRVWCLTCFCCCQDPAETGHKTFVASLNPKPQTPNPKP